MSYSVSRGMGTCTVRGIGDGRVATGDAAVRPMTGDLGRVKLKPDKYSGFNYYPPRQPNNEQLANPISKI